MTAPRPYTLNKSPPHLGRWPQSLEGLGQLVQLLDARIDVAKATRNTAGLAELRAMLNAATRQLEDKKREALRHDGLVNGSGRGCRKPRPGAPA